MMFQKPTEGSKVQVVTDFAPFYVSTKTTKTGTVIRSEKYDSPDSFRILTNDTVFPVSVVPLRYVKSLIYATGEPVATREDTDLTVKVKSSKGDKTYTVTKLSGRYSCDCPGFQFRKTCKHVVSMVV